MTTQVVTVLPDTNVREIARMLLINRISAVPVVDMDGRVLGMLSEGDLMRHFRCAVPALRTARRVCVGQPVADFR